MTSAVGSPAMEDLTARARIRDSAIRLIADRGTEGTTIRDIAKQAGVSGGLVRHHFGSKEDLRSACDSYALAQIVRVKQEAVLDGRLADPGFMSSAQPALLLLVRYIARSILDGSPSADALFAEMVGLAQRWLEDNNPGHSSDPHAYASLLIAMELGVLAMRPQLSKSLGADILTPNGQLRLARARLEFYSKPLLEPELAARARAALDQVEQPATPGQGPQKMGPRARQVRRGKR